MKVSRREGKHPSQATISLTVKSHLSSPAVDDSPSIARDLGFLNRADFDGAAMTPLPNGPPEQMANRRRMLAGREAMVQPNVHRA